MSRTKKPVGPVLKRVENISFEVHDDDDLVAVVKHDGIDIDIHLSDDTVTIANARHIAAAILAACDAAEGKRASERLEEGEDE